MKTITVLSVVLAVLLFVAVARANQLSSVDPSYAQEIDAASALPDQEVEMAWAIAGTRASDGNAIPIRGSHPSSESVPEPGTLWLSLAGIGVLSLRARWVRSILPWKRQWQRN
jgi:hypothetical protein